MGGGINQTVIYFNQNIINILNLLAIIYNIILIIKFLCMMSIQ